MTVLHGKACVEPYIQATVLTTAHTITSGTKTPTNLSRAAGKRQQGDKYDWD